MRIAKKVIVLLCIMLGMLFFNTLRVEAMTFEYGSNKNLGINDKIKITYSDYINKKNNLYCVEKGDFVKKEGKTYKVIGHVKINKKSIVIDFGDGKATYNGKRK